MGVYVTVRLFRNCVAESTWERIYTDSLTLLHNWPDPPLGIGHREVAGVRVTAHTRDFEVKNGWCIVGDANSKLGAESFELPRRLPARRNFAIDETVLTAEDLATDVLQALAEEDDGKPSRLACLLGNKTQGLPYHTLIVAVATLIENRLPGVALACGDFGIADADRACSELTRIFGERFERPVLLDVERILERVPNLNAVSLSARHTRRIAPQVASILERLYASQGMGAAAKALVCTDTNQLSDAMLTALTVMGIRLAELAPQLAPLPDAEDRARTMLRSIAEGTKSQSITLTDMAWDSIESSDDETRELLYLQCQINCECLASHQVFLAVYENRSVRDYVLASWRNERRSPKGIPPEILSLITTSDRGRT